VYIGEASIEELKYLINGLRDARDTRLNKELPTYRQKYIDMVYIKLKEIKEKINEMLNSPTISQAEKYDLEELIKDADELASSYEGQTSNEYIELGRGPVERGGKKRRRTNKRRNNKRKSNKRRKRRYTGKRR
jgi:hypothetical protein